MLTSDPHLRAVHLQAPKVQASKEAKALAASNSSKGKKKVSDLSYGSDSYSKASWVLTRVYLCTEMVQGKDEGEGKQPGLVRPGEHIKPLTWHNS